MSQSDTRGVGSQTPDSPGEGPSNLTESGIIVDTPQETLPERIQEDQSKSDIPGVPESEQTEPRHCWICLQDEGVDSPESLQWRSPCPCNLQAHEECLLEWIADVQSQARSGAGSINQKVLCPQCKAEIKIERPIEFIVALTDLVSAVGQQLLLPTGAGMLLGCLYSGSMVYGFNAIELVFGAEDARRMLFTARDNPGVIRRIIPDSVIDWFFTIIRFTDPFVPTAGSAWVFGVAPLIAPALLLSRTRIADRTFAMLPIMVSVLLSAGNLELQWTRSKTYQYLLSPQNHHVPHWPPSPGLALATLPYIRSAYNELYASLFADLENSWNLAVQRTPREGETAEDVAQAQLARANDGNNILDIEVEVINVEEEHGGAERNRHNPLVFPLPDMHPNPDAIGQQPPDAERPLPNQQQDREAQGGQQQQQDGAPQAEQPQMGGQQAAQPAQPNDAPAANEPWEFRQNINTAQVARSMIGALFFPAISSLMGNLIFRTAPTAWVMKPVKKYSLQQLQATGLLQEKWGRSIVGGCLFVVLKDALTLYCKWRKAKHHGQRKVLDYERNKDKNRKKQANR